MKPFALAAAAIAALSLAGCASGTFVSRESSAQFQKGATTEQQVLAQLGEPDAKAELIDGGRRDIYIYNAGGPSPIDHIPFLAMLTESGYEHTVTVNFDFNARGVLTGISRFRERTG
ncbi:MAG: outer membrane protein assembly factor BamE [Proteobacteria bacterium]|nr:outer membrane protein assembly factor BamE [Pseudomonadota bacterium]